MIQLVGKSQIGRHSWKTT